jgi:menaquinone-specific isochorismate synthase
VAFGPVPIRPQHRISLLSDVRSVLPQSASTSVLADLRGQILDSAATHRTDGRSGRPAQLVRIALAYPETDPLGWLAANEAETQVYWSGRNESLEVAGIGCADSVDQKASIDYQVVLQRLRSAIGAGPGDLRYYGGIRFDRYHPISDEWRSFSAYRFWLPRFELHRDGEHSRIICNLLFPEDQGRIEDILDELDRLSEHVEPMSPDQRDLHVLRRSDFPDRQGWDSTMSWALDSFRSAQLEKIVLARRSDLTFGQTLDPVDLMARLRALTHDCYHFLFQPEPERAFIGSSPERLVSRSGRYVATEAVAGTRPRGSLPDEDAALSSQMLRSEKDRREHEFVRQTVAAAMAPLCTTFQQDQTVSVMRLASRMHLFSGMWGTLNDGMTDADLMRALHPTPAVGGVPTKVAVEAIAYHEPFDRGWYAGPVGWIGTDSSEFAVGIRSALVADNVLSLYAGAGIVEGSVAADEWDEVEQKISDFLQALAES